MKMNSAIFETVLKELKLAEKRLTLRLEEADRFERMAIITRQNIKPLEELIRGLTKALEKLTQTPERNCNDK